MDTILLTVGTETLKVTMLVLVMMVIVDLVNVWTRGKIAVVLKHGRQWRQYVVASFIGAAPGCVGAFTNVSLYIHGMISFGALVGAMAAVSGDEAFVMLAMFPDTALFLFALLFVIGIGVGWTADRLIKKWNIQTCTDCDSTLIHPRHENVMHYIKEHVWDHIIRRHLWKTALWTFGALLVVEIGLKQWNLEALASEYALWLLFLGALIGLIPESGPHLIFVTMFANGLIPFSVLFTSSFVQDGHGMLPMLSYSVRDSMLIKAFNIVFGVTIGLGFYAFGW
ncbi:MAG: arsenic efflux protein [Bacteroidetes bacterium]|nr:arsenic efflux protein [Bacteroidota bacterium]MCW5897529.1 arsenic efflux protein [Bacteroidota bacterium]